VEQQRQPDPAMQAINDHKAVQFLESLREERPRSAVLAIHTAWLRNSPGVGGSAPLDTSAPLDMEILYRAAAATFQDWPPPVPQSRVLPPGGRILNREEASERLHSLTDEETRLLASLFARHVITLSSTATADQDLRYYVDLFLQCISDKKVIDNIVSGAISRHSDDLSDPDFW
jgi:hypothetical protein